MRNMDESDPGDVEPSSSPWSPIEMEAVYRHVRASRVPQACDEGIYAIEASLASLNHDELEGSDIPPELLGSMLRGVHRARAARWLAPKGYTIPVRAAIILLVAMMAITTASFHTIRTSLHGKLTSSSSKVTQPLAPPKPAAIPRPVPPTTTTVIPAVPTTPPPAVSVQVTPKPAPVPVTLPIYQAPQKPAPQTPLQPPASSTTVTVPSVLPGPAPALKPNGKPMPAQAQGPPHVVPATVPSSLGGSPVLKPNGDPLAPGCAGSRANKGCK